MSKTKLISFLDARKSPPSLRLRASGGPRFLVQTRVEKQSREGGLDEAGRAEAPRLARTSTRRRRRELLGELTKDDRGGVTTDGTLWGSVAFLGVRRPALFGR